MADLTSRRPNPIWTTLFAAHVQTFLAESSRAGSPIEWPRHLFDQTLMGIGVLRGSGAVPHCDNP